MDVHPPKNGIFIGIDPYPCFFMSQRRFHLREGFLHQIVAIDQVLSGSTGDGDPLRVAQSKPIE
jgi:hypothetical protein